MRTTQPTNRTGGKQKLITGTMLIVLGLAGWWYITGTPKVAPSPTTTANSTASTTDPFALPPIVPEAKVSTEGWKTCRNEEYGYEFKFPAEWHMYGENALGVDKGLTGESKECNGSINELTTDDQLTGNQGGVEFTIETHLYSYTDATDTEYWNWYLTTKNPKELESVRYALVDNRKALVQLYQKDSGGPLDWHMSAYRDNQTYDISVRNMDSIPTLETILSTFHYLPSITTTTATGAQNYGPHVFGTSTFTIPNIRVNITFACYTRTHCTVEQDSGVYHNNGALYAYSASIPTGIPRYTLQINVITKETYERYAQVGGNLYSGFTQLSLAAMYDAVNDGVTTTYSFGVAQKGYAVDSFRDASITGIPALYREGSYTRGSAGGRFYIPLTEDVWLEVEESVFEGNANDLPFAEKIIESIAVQK